MAAVVEVAHKETGEVAAYLRKRWEDTADAWPGESVVNMCYVGYSGQRE